MPIDPVRLAIDRLTAEKGERKNGIWHAAFTVKDVLEKAAMKNTPDNQRYVLYVISRWYSDTKVLPPQSDNGGFLQMKIRGI